MKRSISTKLAIEVSGTGNRQVASGKQHAASDIDTNQAGCSSKYAFPVLKTRMSPNSLIQFINSGLSDMQISDIREMGFGGLLCLKTDMIPGHLAYWLVSEFDPFTSSLLNNQLPVRDEDVHLSTGLPLGQVTIEQAGKYDQTNEFMKLVQDWKSQYAGVEKIQFSHILSKMAEQREGGEHFKRNFIVFIVSSFLMGVKGNVPSLRILKCLSDVSIIPTLKWCDFTRNNLIDSVRQWRTDKLREANGGRPKTFKGPIMVLIFIYLDRMVFKTRKVARVFPTLCTWTKEEISYRISQEKGQAHRFGAGFIETRLEKHPGCFGEGYVEPNIPAANVPEQDQPDVTDERSRISICIENMAQAGKALARAFENFSEAINNAKIIMPQSVIVGQLSAMADSLLGGFHLTPPSKADGDVGTNSDHSKGRSDDARTEAFNVASGAAQRSKVSGDLDGAHVTADTVNMADTRVHGARVTSTTGGAGDDPCWDDPTFLEALFELSNAFNKDPVNEPLPKKQRVAPEYPTFNLFESQEKSNSAATYDRPEPIVNSPPSAPTSVQIRPIISALPVQTEAKPHSKRDIVVPTVLKSPFLVRNISMLSDLSQAEKDVTELVFRDGLDDSDVLFRNQHFQLRRCDLKSLIVSTKISANVINTWGHLLNKREELKAASSPLRLYAFVTPNGIVCEDGTDYEQLKLMFFPFTLPEPFLICVNFMTRTIEVIHPKRPKSMMFTGPVRTVRDFIRNVMTTKSSKFGKVQFFKCEEFVPKMHMIDEVDDGIYLMCYMETYTGSRPALKTQVVNTRTAAAVDKVLFRQKLKYCFAILTCAQNELSNQVLISARRLNIKTGKQVVEEVGYTDSHLLNYAFSPSDGDAATNDIVVRTNFGQLTKECMSSLRPRKWVADMVIDMFGVYSTIHSPDLLYIPTTARHLNPDRDKTLGRNYIKTSAYMPMDGTGVKAIFIPIIEKEHWFLCVCDLDMKKNYILNSLRSKDPRADLEIAAGVVNNVVRILCRSKEYKNLVGVPLNEFEHQNVPQQSNLHDCGLYVLKWLEAGRDRSKWEAASYYKAMASYRKVVAVTLLRWQENQRKIF
ncbi:uncharacterized protein LOC141627122 [Silene latifolia]|uniref:uncharacterized protein LOC141627122 n=1 Tax=Silene latifolia TaxID=37657 RepID=UPI003D788969